jgi:spore coat polysaccharide biosynthesis protein SpsF
MHNNIGIIIQARTQSRRLENKIILPFFENKSIIEILIDNLRKAFPNNIIVLATTNNPADRILTEIAVKSGINYFAGEEDDVLKRFIDAAVHYKLDEIIRICSDNPFLNMATIKILIETAQSKNYDYVSFKVNGKPAIKTHYGFWTEYLTLNAMKKIQTATNESKYHEHVTNYIYENDSEFLLKWIETPVSFGNNELRFTVDTIDDFELQKKLYKKLQADNNTQDIEQIIKYVYSNSEYMHIMQAQITQNSK